MIDLTSSRRGRKPALCSLCHIVVAVGFIMVLPSRAAEDPYLELLDQEVIKVESVPTDTGGGGTVAPAEAHRSGPAPSRAHFEELLRREHVGTYSFYERLPERSREEIFLDYSDGASIEALRGKIVDRFLHP